MSDQVGQESAFHILSLSGGGYLGLFAAIILADLEHRLGRPIAKAFDLIAGTSIGGLIALDVATPHAQRIIAGLAEHAIQENTSRIDDFIGHQAPSAKFYRDPNPTGDYVV